MPGGEGARLMERFLRFLAENPGMQCDFISLHRKGAWTNEEGSPKLARSVQAVRATAAAALKISAERFRNLTIINDEADMLVGFDRPFEPRMTEQFACWLAAQMIAYDQLAVQHAGFRFAAASDNANQQLVRGPFDGRRSIMTTTGQGPDDLLKLPAYNFYELLRLLGRNRVSSLTPGAFYPNNDIFHLIAADEDRISALFAFYPDANSAGARPVAYAAAGVPWERANLTRFAISRRESNSYTEAGRRLDPALDAAAIRRIRFAQELAIENRPGQAIENGRMRLEFSIEPYETVLWLLTPYAPDPVEPPAAISAERAGGRVILRWEPIAGAALLGWQVRRESDGALSPVLRSAMWVDDVAGIQPEAYSVCALSVSGVRSEWRSIWAR
jgi:hypothetical protein